MISVIDGVTWATLTTALGGFLLWWFVRRKNEQIWLPILSVVRPRSQVLPELKRARPPLIPLLAFIVLACLLSGFAMRLAHEKPSSIQAKSQSVIIFFDLSPSVSATASIDQIVNLALDTIGQFPLGTDISYATSHDSDKYPWKSQQDTFYHLSNLGFHSAGIQLGGAIEQLLSQEEPSDALIILGDKDAHSWEHFRWKKLSHDIIIYISKLN